MQIKCTVVQLELNRSEYSSYNTWCFSKYCITKHCAGWTFAIEAAIQYSETLSHIRIVNKRIPNRCWWICCFPIHRHKLVFYERKTLHLRLFVNTHATAFLSWNLNIIAFLCGTYFLCPVSSFCSVKYVEIVKQNTES